MPIYVYICKQCDARSEVLRAFADYQVEPTTEENNPSCNPPWDGHKWERELGKQTVIKAPGFGSKGFWIQVAVLIGGSICWTLQHLLGM